MTNHPAGYLYTYRIGKSVYSRCSDIADPCIWTVGVLQSPIGVFVFEAIYAGMPVGLVACWGCLRWVRIWALAEWRFEV